MESGRLLSASVDRRELTRLPLVGRSNRVQAINPEAHANLAMDGETCFPWSLVLDPLRGSGQKAAADK